MEEIKLREQWLTLSLTAGPSGPFYFEQKDILGAFSKKYIFKNIKNASQNILRVSVRKGEMKEMKLREECLRITSERGECKR
jgi:hypothetical protein